MEHFQTLCVVIHENHHSDREIYIQSLQQLGVKLSFVKSEDEALSQLQHSDASIYIYGAESYPSPHRLKIHLQKIRENRDKLFHLSTIMIYPSDFWPLVQEAYQQKVDHCLAVPFHGRQLAQIVEHSLSKQHPGGPLSPKDHSAQNPGIQAFERLKSYISPILVERILSSEPEKPFGALAQRKRATFMFIDLRNFTAMADDLPPETMSDIIKEYNSEVHEIITRYSGAINKFLGDGILATFGDPISSRTHRLNALQAGVAIRERVIDFSKRMNYLPQTIQVGIGVHSGKAVIGNFGTQTQIDYTAIGPAVNLAARLQAFANSNQVIASSDTYEELRDHLELAHERQEKVKGLKDLVLLAEIVSIKSGQN